MVPRLKLENIIQILKDTKKKENLSEATEIISAEQDEAFISRLLYDSVNNPDFCKGFIVCYLAIRNEMMSKGVDELERMFKL